MSLLGPLRQLSPSITMVLKRCASKGSLSLASPAKAAKVAKAAPAITTPEGLVQKKLDDNFQGIDDDIIDCKRIDDKTLRQQLLHDVKSWLEDKSSVVVWQVVL